MAIKLTMQMKGLDKLERDLKDMERRAKQIANTQVQVQGEMTSQKRDAIIKNVKEHLLKGRPLKTKW